VKNYDSATPIRNAKVVEFREINWLHCQIK